MHVFFTGTDTDVGKTFVAAAFTKAWGANYWKPVQTGTLADAGDTATVACLTGRPPQTFCRPQVELSAPLCPWLASCRENQEPVRVADICIPPQLANDSKPLVIEGAGGLLVPLNETETMLDLLVSFLCPVVVVARSGLGTINHTLLSLAELRDRGVGRVLVVLNGPLNVENKRVIETFAPEVEVVCVPHSSNGIEDLLEYIPSIEIFRREINDAAGATRTSEC